jgi:hypothetical protein
MTSENNNRQDAKSAKARIWGSIRMTSYGTCAVAARVRPSRTTKFSLGALGVLAVHSASVEAGDVPELFAAANQQHFVV